MNAKFKEPRIWANIFILIAGFFPFLKVTVKTESELFSLSESSTMDISGYGGTGYSIIDLLIFIIPIALIVMEFMRQTPIRKRVAYLIGGLIGILVLIICMIITKGAVIKEKSVDELYGFEMTVKASMQIGFWCILAADIVIVAYTLFKDFAINKETLNEKGFKAAMADVKDSISGDIFGEEKTCPNCGNTVSAGKKFCLKCGAKVIDDVEEANLYKTNKAAKVPNKIITVNEYVKSMKDITCPKCGITIAASSKFCPDCGETVVLKIKPNKCIKCGGLIVDGKSYCGDCGSKIEELELVKKCPDCNSELIYLKPYCVECGRKIY